MTKLAAVIVESRPLPNLQEKIVEHMTRLPNLTQLHAFLSPEAEKICHILLPSNIEPLRSSFEVNDYNKLLTSPDFWKQFLDYDRVLIFQADSEILKDTGLEEFYQWDYIGAPWRWNDRYAGNGGLSLRNPAVMYEITSRYPWYGNMNEDHWITLHMHQFKIGNLAPIEVAKKFSVEAVFELGSWGAHAIDKWLTPEQCDMIRRQYPLMTHSFMIIDTQTGEKRHLRE